MRQGINQDTPPVPVGEPTADGLPPTAEMAAQQEQRLVGTFRSLRHRNYRLFFFGQMISLVGGSMQTAALMWLAFELTYQSKWPALVSVAQVAPTFLLGAWAGILADYWPKRSLLLVTQSAFLAVAIGLTLLVLGIGVTPWQLVGLMAVSGLIQAVDLPVRLAFIKDLVGYRDLMNAVALNSLVFNLARLIGPAVAGLVLVYYGPGYCFLANAISYAGVLLALWRMDITGSPPHATPAGPPRDLLGGFRYLIEQPRLGLTLLLAGVMALCGWPFLALLPALVQNVLGLEARAYSLMLSATGMGALVAALTVATFGSPARRQALVATGVVLVGTALIGLSLVNRLWLAIPCCALIGFGLILIFSTSQSALQLGSTDQNRGRVMGIWAMTISGAVPLGNLIVGPAADRWGTSLVLRCQGVIGGAVALALLLMTWAWSRAPSENFQHGHDLSEPHC